MRIAWLAGFLSLPPSAPSSDPHSLARELNSAQLARGSYYGFRAHLPPSSIHPLGFIDPSVVVVVASERV